MLPFQQEFDKVSKDLERNTLSSEQWVVAEEGKHVLRQIPNRTHPVLGMGVPVLLGVGAIASEIQLVDRTATDLAPHFFENFTFVRTHLDTEAGTDPPAAPVFRIRSTLSVEATFADDQACDVLRSDHGLTIISRCDRNTKAARRPPCPRALNSVPAERDQWYQLGAVTSSYSAEAFRKRAHSRSLERR
jgi:hypothetical protein